MDAKVLMAELQELGCILQSREELALSIIKKHAEESVEEILESGDKDASK